MVEGHVRRRVWDESSGSAHAYLGALKKLSGKWVALWPRGTAGPHVTKGLGDCNDFLEPSKFHGPTGELGEDSRGCSGANT